MQPFWDTESRAPQSPAFILEDSVVTYAALTEKIGHWCERLAGIAQGRRPLVALEIELDADSIAAYLACLKSGFPVLVAETGTFEPDARLTTIWTPDIIVRGRGDGVKAVLQFDGEATPPSRGEMHADLRLLLSTSGSTGDPKLVRLSGENIVSNADSIAEYLGITASDRAMSTLPLFYSYGLSVLHSYLQVGAAMVLTERSVLDPGFWDLFGKAGATSMALVPHQFDLLERTGFKDMDLPSLRYVTQAGGKLAPTSVRRFAEMARSGGWQLVIMYGQTEASPRISYVPPESLDEAHDTIGRAVPGGRMWLRDEHGTVIEGHGVAGELVYAGPNVMMGYGVEPGDLARGPEHTELSTGDIAERTADGFYRIVGRLKRFVKLYGMRVSLDQIETLLSDEGVEGYACAVDDHLVVLHVSGQDAFIRRTIADEYELPESAVRSHAIAEVPLMPSGKTDRKVLQQWAAEAMAADEETESGSIGEVIARVTRTAEIQPGDTFASLGGDSLGYLHVEMALEERLGHVPQDWENQPIATLEQMTPKSRSRFVRPVGVDVLLRVAAISMVVAVHSGLHAFFGGPWMLLVLMGYLMARFQLNLLGQGRIGTFVVKMLYPIVPIYFGMIVLVNIAMADVPLAYFGLWANYFRAEGRNPAELYWYVSAYVQIIALIGVAFAFPALRTWAMANKWGIAAIVMVVTLAIQAGLVLSPLHSPEGLILWPAPHPDSHGLMACIPVFCFGWMLRVTTTRAQVRANLVLGLVTLLVFAQFRMSILATVYLGATFVLLAWNPTVQLPNIVATTFQKAATVTLFVYLFHVLVIYVLSKVFDDPLPLAVAAIPLSFVLAYVIKAVFDYFDNIAAALLLRGNRSARPTTGALESI